MDNIFFQISLGLIPSICVFLILLFKQKTHKVRNAIFTSLLLLGFIAGVIGGIGSIKGKSNTEGLSADESINVIYSLAKSGEIEQSLEILKSIRENTVYNDSMALCAARLYGMNGNFKASRALFDKALKTLKNKKIKEEYDAVAKAADGEKIDYVLLSHFDTGEGSMPELSYEEAAEGAYDAVEEAISEIVSKNKEQSYKRAAKLIADTTNQYNRYVDYGELDKKEAEKQLKRMESLKEDYPKLFGMPQLRIARLKLQILCEDFKGLAKEVEQNSDYNELLIVSELYMNSYIKPSNFSDDYTEGYDEKLTKVAHQLEKVYDEFYSDESKNIRNSVKKQIDILENSAKDPVIFKIEEGLLDYTNGENAYDSTKVFLQLSKIANYTGNNQLSEKYISSSFSTVSDCKDDNFTQPMYEIIGIISEKDEPEKIKNVANYVDKVLTNTTTIKMSENHRSENPEASSESKKADSKEKNNDTANNENFKSYLTDYVSKKRASINIINVDTSEFSKVSAIINIDDDLSHSPEKLKELISVQDCGVDITDFSVEKIEYGNANILLCCDVSGSMAGEGINSLKKAITHFIENKSNIDNIALMSFSNSVESYYGFDVSQEELLQAAGSLYALGGTNIYDAVINSISRFEIRPGELNCIILLSDGEDNNPRSSSEIYSYIGEPCMEKNITLYSIGLGSSVDSQYLSDFANSTGGSFLYVNDSESLYSFYDYLHNQILNQYRITFTAEDTLSVSRKLKVALASDQLTYDIVDYSLESSTPVIGDGENESIYLENKSITGLDPKLIFKSNSDYQINLLGSGFEADDAIGIELKGNLNYGKDKIHCEFIDAGKIKVVIPAGIACGTYDVHVTIDGKKAILDNGLTVATQGSEKTTKFGPYVFTSYTKVEDRNVTTLSGYVTLNGWLRFNDEIVLTGDLESDRIEMTDGSGGYIKYFPGTSEGLASYLAMKNRVVDLPPLGKLNLYNDPSNKPTSDDYRVDAVVIPMVYFTNAFKFNAPGFMLYPDRIVLDVNKFNTEFPFQDTVLKTDKTKKPFSFEIEFQCLLTSKNIGINLEYESKSDTKTYTQFNFGAMPMYFSPNSFDVKINTIKNEYYIKYTTKVLFLNAKGIGFSLKWDGNLVPKEFRLYADKKINTTISGVPVTISDFMLGVTDIDIKNISSLKFEGSMDVSTATVSSVLPKLEKWVDDVSVLKLDDAKLAFSPGKKYISVSTDVELFNEITLAKALIEAGNFEYSNLLLNMDNEEVRGLHANLMLGIIWESNNCDIDLSGTTDLSVTNKLIGVTVTGVCDLELKWWAFKESFYSQGEALIGIYENHSGEIAFVVKTRAYKSKDKSKEIYLVWTKGAGLDFGVETV